MNVNVALATRDDVPRILEISNWAAAHTVANFATSPEPLEDWLRLYDDTHSLHPWLVARIEDGEIVGFAKSSPHKSRGAYRWTADVSVYLDPHCHRQGVGTLLYSRLIPLLQAQGYVTLIAGITAGHRASERLHEKVGFTRCATFHRVGWKDGAWRDVGYWEMSLSGSAEGPGELKPVQHVASGSTH